MSQETICGSHENDRVVMVEGCNMMALVERGLEAGMAGRVAKQFTAKCEEVGRLHKALRERAIFFISKPDRAGDNRMCVVCNGEWHEPGPENHNGGCLAAPRPAPAPSAGEEIK